MPVDIIDTPTERELLKRSKPPRAVVVHTTGATNLERIIRYYRSKDGLQPHYMIDLSGAVRRFVDEGKVAYHCAIKDARARLYQLGYATWREWTWDKNKLEPVHQGQEFSGYRAWREKHFARGRQSPLDLVTGAHPNATSVGIELQQPEQPGPNIFTPAQYSALAELLVDIGGRYGLVLDAETVLGHYDCDPMNRCNAGGSTDPGRDFAWNILWDLVGKR